MNLKKHEFREKVQKSNVTENIKDHEISQQEMRDVHDLEKHDNNEEKLLKIDGIYR